MLDRLNTHDMLERRQGPIASLNCVVCLQEREDRDHLSFDCFAQKINLSFDCGFSKDCWSTMGIDRKLELNLSDRFNAAANVWNVLFFLEYGTLLPPFWCIGPAHMSRLLF
jgi:hypothetical protein